MSYSLSEIYTDYKPRYYIDYSISALCISAIESVKAVKGKIYSVTKTYFYDVDHYRPNAYALDYVTESGATAVLSLLPTVFEQYFMELPGTYKEL